MAGRRSSGADKIWSVVVQDGKAEVAFAVIQISTRAKVSARRWVMRHLGTIARGAGLQGN